MTVGLRCAWQCASCGKIYRVLQLAEIGRPATLDPPPDWTICENRAYCTDHALMPDRSILGRLGRRD